MKRKKLLSLLLVLMMLSCVAPAAAVGKTNRAIKTQTTMKNNIVIIKTTYSWGEYFALYTRQGRFLDHWWKYNK